MFLHNRLHFRPLGGTRYLLIATDPANDASRRWRGDGEPEPWDECFRGSGSDALLTSRQIFRVTFQTTWWISRHLTHDISNMDGASRLYALVPFGAAGPRPWKRRQ
jgi:hypothetical protein